VIISESMAALMGDEGRLGRHITYNALRLTIVGIIGDFVYNDIYTTNRPPVVIFCNPQETRLLNIRFYPGVDLHKAVTQIAAIVTPYNPGHPFEYKFFDEQFDQLFKTEKVIGKLAGIFAALSIVISCLGLFGLAAYSAERRTKEIGIRKILGASVFGLVQLLSKDFLRLVTIAYIIAFPAAWWTMHDWLRHFEYRTALHWWVFVIAGIGALLIALLTVSFQALKAAGVNPLRSLRTE
jgi:ABC-type antimicrobial peptide transport system permease subunit